MKVAVVGSGVSGLAATWLLNEHSDHTVDLYEADSRAGGHANTVRCTLPQGGGEGVDVDTGFIVFNPTTYPNFLRFLAIHPSLKPLILPTEMTFSVTRDGGAFEWAGKNLRTVFCQLKNLFDPGMWRLVWDVARFNACAGRILLGGEAGKQEDITIGEYLEREGYSSSFRENYLIPMTAAIWSTPPDRCAAEFPAKTLIQFLHNHHLLQITGKPSWLTIQGGSKAYVDHILSSLSKSQLHLSTPVISLTTIHTPTSSEDVNTEPATKVLLKTSTGTRKLYDHVILACHSDTALRILRAGGGSELDGGTDMDLDAGRMATHDRGGITRLEQNILSLFKWNRNEVVLHSDVRLMPRSRIAWSCWNYLTRSTLDEQGNRKANDDIVSLTYGMNDLQHISESKYGPVLVTLNPPFEPRKELVAGRWKYDHPVLDGMAVRAQNQMHKIQGKRGISFAGAYLRYGFHEDGFTSGLAAAAALGSKSALSSKLGDEEGSQNQTLTVRLPFPIEYVDQEARQSMFVLGLAAVFDFMEASGARALVGFIGTVLLRLLGRGLEGVRE